MKLNRMFLLTSAFAISALLSIPAFAAYYCDAHATHIDHEIGAEDALDAYHVLHGDKADDHHIIDKLKAEHPDVEKELEEYVAAGCSDKELEAHAHDAH